MSKRNSKSFSTENQPTDRKPRGKSKKTIILNAIRNEALIGMDKDSTNEQVEEAFFGHVSNLAFTPELDCSSQMLTLLANKGWPNEKPVSPMYNFDKPENCTPWEAINCVLSAISKGELPMSEGVPLMGVLNKFVENEEIIKRLDDIEARFGQRIT